MKRNANGQRAVHRNPNLGQTFALLTRKRQELFRPVLENPRGYVLLSVRELARRLKVDAATAVRIILKMGFGSYREFQHYLHELSVSQATSLDMMQSSKTKGSSISAHIQEAVDHDVQSLQRFRNVLDSERIAAVAKRLHQATRIIVLGGDLAANLVGYLHYHLILLGLPAMAATTSGEAAHLTRSAGKSDVVIALSFQARPATNGGRAAAGEGQWRVLHRDYGHAGVADCAIRA